MGKRSRIFTLARHYKIFGIVIAIFAVAAAAPAAEMRVAHQIEIELIPTTHKLNGTDTMTIQSNDVDHLDFRLSERVSILMVKVNGQPGIFDFKAGRLRLRLAPHKKNSELQVIIQYTARFDDPFPVRPLNADNPGFGVSATISDRGSFLLAGSNWYPELTGGSAAYRLKIRAPAGMIAVTAGESMGHVTAGGKTVSEWKIEYPVEGLSLSAAPYIVQQKPVGRIVAATYLFPQNNHLAASYLNATARYISLYSDRFGPYPFRKFAVVENFFPTGFGFPSYTLLGSAVLRLPFIVHTSLGHEIAHCWWGNGVYVDDDSGNWSEGLTTYVADYYFNEMKSEKAAQEYRQQILRNFATLVKPQNDLALEKFYSRHDPATKTVGYDKGAMVFHMLRRLVGEKAFWGSLQDIYRERLFQRTSWTDFQKAFEKRAGRSLERFFNQWVTRKGAPRFALDRVSADRHGDGWITRGSVVQQKPYFDFELKLALQTRDSEKFQKIDVSGEVIPFEMKSETQPKQLVLDPDVDLLRHLYHAEIPPAVNSLKGSTTVLAVLTDDLDPEIKRAAEILVLSLGLKNCRFVTAGRVTPQQLAENDILIIGYPKHRNLLTDLPAQVKIQEASFFLNGTSYEQATDVFFGVFTHPSAENRVISLFLPLSTQFAEAVAAKITHYGKYSYLAFRSAKNMEKGSWRVLNSPLVYRWEHLNE